MDIYLWIELVALTAAITVMPIAIIELSKKDIER